MKSQYAAPLDQDSDSDCDDEEEEFFPLDSHGLTLEPNVFGHLVLCCAKKDKSWPDYTRVGYAAFIAFAAVYIQYAFAFCMIPAISTDGLQAKYGKTGDKSENLFREWRQATKWGGAELDKKGVEEAKWVCSGKAWTWHESVVANFMEYSAPVKTPVMLLLALLTHPLDGATPTRGAMFGFVALLLWFATVVQHGRYILLKFLPLLCVNLEEGVWQPRGKEDIATSYGPGTKSVVLVTAFIRLGLLFQLGTQGGNFLAHTDNLKDFILNSIALGFVLEIPTLFYNSFASIDEQEVLDGYNKDKKIDERESDEKEPQIKAKHFRYVAKSAGFLSLVVTAIWVCSAFYGDKGLFEFAQHLRDDVADEACEGFLKAGS